MDAGVISGLTPELRDVVTLLKMAAERVLAGDAPSAGRGVASISGMTIVIAAETMVELADVLTVAEQTHCRLTTERDEALENWSREAAERDAYRTDLARLTAERDSERRAADAGVERVIQLEADLAYRTTQRDQWRAMFDQMAARS